MPIEQRGWQKADGQKQKALIRYLFLAMCFFFSHPIWADNPVERHFQTGLAYERLGRYDEAYTELQLAFALDQNNTPLATALGIVASRLGRLDVAQRALERSISLDSSSIASYFQIALIYEKKNSNDRALDSWRRFLSLTQDDQLKWLAKKHIAYLETHG